MKFAEYRLLSSDIWLRERSNTEPSPEVVSRGTGEYPLVHVEPWIMNFGFIHFLQLGPNEIILTYSLALQSKRRTHEQPVYKSPHCDCLYLLHCTFPVYLLIYTRKVFSIVSLLFCTWKTFQMLVCATDIFVTRYKRLGQNRSWYKNYCLRKHRV